MCELFAFSALAPTTARISLEELARHGGGNGPHRDGWGAAFYQGHDAMLVRDSVAANDSACMHFLLDHAIQSRCVIAHVRKALRGARTLANTQPFARELGGRLHVFAHNGMLTDIDAVQRSDTIRFLPIGESDSELAFCILLDRVQSLWSREATPPIDLRRRIVDEFAQEMRRLGPMNFVYCDGDALFAHADGRTQSDGTIRPPGLHWLCRDCTDAEPPLAAVSFDDASRPQRLALIASVPLSAEPWAPLASGELAAFRDGRRIL